MWRRPSANWPLQAFELTRSSSSFGHHRIARCQVRFSSCDLWDEGGSWVLGHPTRSRCVMKPFRTSRSSSPLISCRLVNMIFDEGDMVRLALSARISGTLEARSWMYPLLWGLRWKTLLVRSSTVGNLHLSRLENEKPHRSRVFCKSADWTIWVASCLVKRTGNGGVSILVSTPAEDTSALLSWIGNSWFRKPKHRSLRNLSTRTRSSAACWSIRINVRPFLVLWSSASGTLSTPWLAVSTVQAINFLSTCPRTTASRIASFPNLVEWMDSWVPARTSFHLVYEWVSQGSCSPATWEIWEVRFRAGIPGSRDVKTSFSWLYYDHENSTMIDD